MRPHDTICLVLIASCVLPFAGCSAHQNSIETRPFYQKEIDTETHGKKTMFDRVVEVDPGGLDVELASDYEEHAPATIAVLPFTDRGSAQYTVDKIPLSFRNQAGALRLGLDRCPTAAQVVRRIPLRARIPVINPIAVDAVLQSHGINNADDLDKVSVLQLGKWFHCDAVIYGTVDHYEAYYLALVSGYQVGVTSRMVSTHDGETLDAQPGQPLLA